MMAVAGRRRVVKTIEGVLTPGIEGRTVFQKLEEDMKKALKVETRPEVLKIKRPHEYFKIRR